MAHLNQQSSGFENGMPTLSTTRECFDSREAAGSGENSNNTNHSSRNGAIKKTYRFHNKKAKEKPFGNNHGLRYNGNFFNQRNKSDRMSNEWRPFQNQYNGDYKAEHANHQEGGGNSVDHVDRSYQDQKHKQFNYNQNSKQLGYHNSHRNNFKHNYYDDRPFHSSTNNNSGRSHPGNEHYSKVNPMGRMGDYGKIQNFHKNKQSNYRNGRSNMKQDKFQKKVNVASQRERLEEMIKNRTLECLVCCEIFKYNDKIWCCKQCFHILHLKCTQAWANSSKIENGWRCPACQNVCADIPKEYRCFCEKVKDPRTEAGLTPHSCGEVCLREGRMCDHRCLILCHPGPCPDCLILIKKLCGCGKTEQQVTCSADIEIVCTNTCDKLLECGLHRCKNKCHSGDCRPCEEILRQICHCGKQNREVGCSVDSNKTESYSCQDTCDKFLSCGNHKCQEVCHDGHCKPCSKDVSLVKSCFCGKTPLKTPRESCLDPIPSCGLPCHKILKCGPPSAPHICKSVCHDDDCPPCDLTTVLKCRCGFMDKEIPCQELTTKADDARCGRKCTKKRLCGKHKCNQLCCIEIEHVCPLPCKHILSCGIHRCELTCHSGRCKPCIETSFEELYCECGSSVIYPPVPCGTKPPTCDKPCRRTRECSHEVNHTCHTGPCPPCTVLCKRWCYGNHEQRSTIPCHQENFSCGLPCGKLMPCGRHKCNKPCHLGSCPVPCTQPCTIERPSCGHPCNAPCHEPPCPEINCKNKVPVTCSCGLQKGVRTCNEVIDEYRKIEMAILSEKMLNMTKNEVVDISDINRPKRPDVLKILECTEECRAIERNRRFALALQIRNPDISQKLTPRYSDFMRGWAKKDPHFCQRVHNKLTELVQLSKQSKQKSRSYSFESMNRDKRHFIHEYCEHFGCESAGYDAEPNRNIIATAIKDKSWLPSMSLLEVIQRENGQRKVPGPSVLDRNSLSKPESVALKSLGRTFKWSNDGELSKK